MVQGILYSLLQNYKQQNTWEKDDLEMATKFFHRHMRRGWNRAQIKEYILLVDIRLRKQQKLPQTKPAKATNRDGKDWVFLCIEYCGNDLPQSGAVNI